MSDIITATFTLEPGGYLGKATAGNHDFFVDEPIEKGGSDQYASPKNYLLGALASCTAITMSMYANRKGWETGTITIHVEMEENRSIDGKGFVFHKTVHFANRTLTEEQLERLLLIGSKCPVNKILTSEVEMKMNVAEVNA